MPEPKLISNSAITRKPTDIESDLVEFAVLLVDYCKRQGEALSRAALTNLLLRNRVAELERVIEEGK